MTRSLPPQTGHCGEVARQGGVMRSSPQRQVDGEGGGGCFYGGVLVTESSSGGDGGGGNILEHQEVN
jgi:hypothetical protein